MIGLKRVIMISCVCLLAVGGGTVSAAGVSAETDHLMFVSEYIRELSEQEGIRKQEVAEMKEPGTNALISAIHYDTRMQLALSADINMMGGMHLFAQFSFLPKQIAQFYVQKGEVLSEMERIASAMIEGPKPGVDYTKMAVEMPKLRAQLEDIDDTFIKVSVLVFATLIDPKPDKHNHLTYLIITREQRKNLLDSMKIDFGGELNAKNQPYLVSAAGVIYDGLHKGYRYADDPWN